MLHKKPRVLAAGLVFGFCVLLKASVLLGLAGLLVAFAWLSGRREVRRALLFAGGCLAPFLLMQLLGWALYGEGYPGYGEGARLFRMTRDFGGAVYQGVAPSLQFAGDVSTGIFLRMIVFNISEHLWSMMLGAGAFVFLFGLVGSFVKPPSPDKPDHRLLAAFAFSHYLLLTATFYFLHQLESGRYSLPMLVLLAPVAVVGIDRVIKNHKWSAAIIAVGFSMMTLYGAAVSLKHLAADRAQYANPAVQQMFFVEPVDWVERHIAPNQLLATNYYLRGFQFDRSVIALPVNRHLTRRSLVQFLLAHRSAALLLDVGNNFQKEWRDPQYMELLHQAGLTTLEQNERFLLLSFKENADSH